MRSALLIGCLLWVAVYVHSLTREERTVSIQKRAASPQVYQGQQGNNWNQTQQFQWIKVNGQWVRRDGTNKLPGYSQPNVPYNQTGNQWNGNRGDATPVQPQGANIGNQSRPSSGPQQPSSGHVTPQRQGATSSQGSIGWNPSADRALTQDVVKTTPRPTTTTTTTTRAPQTPPPVQRPQGPTPTPVRAPFGSGMGGQLKPQNGRYNPDASLTYSGLPPQTNPNSNKANVKPTPAGPPGSNPWGNLFK